MKTPKNQPSIPSIRRASTPSKAPLGASGLFTRKNAVYAALAGALGGIIAATPACGEPFTSGSETTNADAGTGGSAGNTVEGGSGGNAGSGATAGAGGEAGNIPDAGPDADAGNCDGVEVTLTDMAEYEYIFREGGCVGPIIATSLENADFETGANTVCLPGGKNYVAMIQVKDELQINTLNLFLPDDSVISTAKMTTLVETEPMDSTLSDSLCNAQSGTIDCVDADPSNTTHFVCTGMASASNGFRINLPISN